MTAASIIVGVVLDIFAMAIALLAVACYLAFLLRAANRRADLADFYEREADGWKANYYEAAGERDSLRKANGKLARRNTALTGQLNTFVDMFSADVQALPTTPDQEA